MISSRLPAIAFATLRRGTPENPIYQHTAVLVQQHSEGSLNPDPNKPALSRPIYNNIYGPIQEEISKIVGLIDSNPSAAKTRLSVLFRDLTNHTIL